MARFRFRLDVLRRLRERHRDELRGRLAEAFQAEQVLADQRAAVAAEAQSAATARRQIALDGTMNVTRAIELQRYQLTLEAQARVLADQAAQLAAEVEQRRQAVAEADREVRVLDKLRQRRRREHEQSERAADAKRLDEIATTRWEDRRP